MAAVGDSWSSGATESDVPWPALLARGLNLELHNLAVFGSSTTEVLHEQLPGALGVRPDLLSAVCGANDVLSSTRMDVDGFAEALDAVLATARASIPGVLLVTATIPDLTRFIGYRPRSRARKSRAFAQVSERIRSIAERHDAICVDVARAGYAASRASYAKDGFHPSPAGHRFVSDGVARAVCARWPAWRIA